MCERRQQITDGVGPVVAVRLSVQVKLQEGKFEFFLEIKFNNLSWRKKYIKFVSHFQD